MLTTLLAKIDSGSVGGAGGGLMSHVSAFAMWIDKAARVLGAVRSFLHSALVFVGAYVLTRATLGVVTK